MIAVPAFFGTHMHLEVTRHVVLNMGDAASVPVVHYLSPTHGHTLLMGSVIPVIMAFSLGLVEERLGLGPRRFWLAFFLYAAGSLAALTLLLYKGLAIV